MQRRVELLKKEQKKKDHLNSKIKAMESKLLAGNVVDRSDEAKRALEAKKQEVIEQKVGGQLPRSALEGSRLVTLLPAS